MVISRRQFLGVFSAAAMSVAVTGAAGAAEAYPSRPITLIVQAAAGGASDLIARMMAQKLSANLGAQIVIDNVPAAGGNVAVQRVIHSKPDGYTLLICGSKSAIAESLFRSRPFNLSKELVQIAPIGFADLVLVVNSKSSLKSVQDLVREIKARPGKITVGVGDTVGGIQHLGAELLKSAVQGDFLIVPYGSASKLEIATRAGDVDAAFELMPAITPMLQQGDLRALATTGAQRNAGLPDVPTMGEAGFPKAELTTRSFVAAPVGTPPAVIAKLNDAINKVLVQPDFQKLVKGRGTTVATPTTPAETQRMMDADIEKWRGIVKLSKVSL